MNWGPGVTVNRERTLGQIRGIGRCDFSVLSEESLERIFGLKVSAKFWGSVNVNYSVIRDSFPNAVDATRYLPPVSGLDKHVIIVGPSLLFIHGGLLREEQEEGIELNTYECLFAALKGAALSNGLNVAVNPDHRSRLAGDQAAVVLVPPSGPLGTALLRFLPLGTAVCLKLKLPVVRSKVLMMPTRFFKGPKQV